MFSKLDAQDGFWSIHLDTPSFLTTFNTHKGCYQFLHMPFGLKCPKMCFKLRWTKSLIGFLASFPYMMTSVYGKDTTEHDKNLLKLMQTAQDHGLVFNSNKCSICQPQISFYGAIFTVQDMKPDPAKVQALQDLPAPHNPKQLQCFLGLFNYLHPFLPGLSSKTTFLGEQVTNWDWNPSTDQFFPLPKVMDL